MHSVHIFGGGNCNGNGRAGRDADRITGRLWQGAYPQFSDPIFQEQRFDAVVFCASELRPPASEFPGVICVYAPMEDVSSGPAADRSAVVANFASAYVAELLRNGRKVYVSCAAGRNRSGLVTALTMIRLGWSGPAAVHRIQERRPNALTNRFFAGFAANIKAGQLTPAEKVKKANPLVIETALGGGRL